MNQRDLFEKYLRGNIGEEEAGQLIRWMKEDPSHLQLFEEYKEHWYQPEGDSFEVDQAFTEFKNRTNSVSPAEKAAIRVYKTRKLLVNLSKAAAILVIGIISGIAIYELGTVHQDTRWNTISADGGQKSKIELSDGTVVWLNSESALKFPARGFSRKSRQVSLIGEAYFNVAHDKKAPFIVKTDDYDIEVLGTEFNVMAYEDFKRTETTLVNGLVKITRGENELVMEPGQTVVFSKNRFSLEKGKIEQAVSWKDNKFYFDAIPFSELVSRLERWYDVEIKVSDSELGNRIYTGVFKNEETIWQVLDVIEYTTPIRYERTGFRKIEIFNN